jgi:hypothetical protein
MEDGQQVHEWHRAKMGEGGNVTNGAQMKDV